MSCCSVDPFVCKTYLRVTGDNSPDTETKVYTVIVYKCINPNCADYGKTWEEEILTEHK